MGKSRSPPKKTGGLVLALGLFSFRCISQCDDAVPLRYTISFDGLDGIRFGGGRCGRSKGREWFDRSPIPAHHFLVDYVAVDVEHDLSFQRGDVAPPKEDRR
jgi:hypothetical protein